MDSDFTNALRLLEEKEAKTPLSTGSPEDRFGGPIVLLLMGRLEMGRDS